MRQVSLRAHEQELASIFAELGVYRLQEPTAALPSQQKRGPKVDERRYARVAIEYERAYLASSAHPTRDVQRALKIKTPSTARAAVAKARQFGFLIPRRPGRGEKGGHATLKS